MARPLWLLRHGDAIPHGAKPDADRELTPHGEAQARTAGRALARLGVELAACLASPKVRARDTARLACASLGVAPREAGELARGLDLAAAVALLDGVGDPGPVLLVGHEPDLSRVVWAASGARVAFPKGGLALVELADGGRLGALLRPADLEGIAG